MALVLYNHDLLADAYKVRLLLSLLGLPYESRTVAMLPGAGADAPAFRALSPPVPCRCSSTATRS